MKYYILIYTDNLPANVGGRANGPVIRIKNKYRDDKGILEHEKCHVRQAYMGLFIFHTLLYRFVRPYRKWAEVQAWRIQLKYNPEYLEGFADMLANRYNLNITIDEARRLLREK